MSASRFRLDLDHGSSVMFIFVHLNNRAVVELTIHAQHNVPRSFCRLSSGDDMIYVDSEIRLTIMLTKGRSISGRVNVQAGEQESEHRYSGVVQPLEGQKTL